MRFFKRNKWALWWALFGVFVIMFIIYIIEHISKNDFNSALLQFGSILIPLFAAIIIMLQNNEQIDKSTKAQLDHLQKLNDKEIEEMQKLFQKQIDTLIQGTNEQIKTLQENTNRQIKNYTEQTQNIIIELSQNSKLLGELLQRELEKALTNINQQILLANKQLKSLEDFQFLRTDIEKEQQLVEQKHYISRLQGAQRYFMDKLDAILNFLKN